MSWIVGIAILFVVATIVFIIGNVLRNTEAEDPANRADVRDAQAARKAGRIIVGATVVVFLLFFGLSTVLRSVHQVGAGHVGVVYQFGDIVGQRGEGLQWTWPWQTIKIESTQVQKETFGDDEEPIVAFSQETQDVFIVTTLNYQVSPRAVQNLYRTVGPDWFDRLVLPRLNQHFKAATVEFRAVEIAPNREVIRDIVKASLGEDLGQFSIEVQDLLIDNIDFTPEFKNSIEQKQIATQDALREQERVKQAEFQAQQAIEQARGEAEAIRVRAEGQAEANRLLDASLTPLVIQFQALEKLADNVQIALIPSGQGIILDPAQLLGTN